MGQGLCDIRAAGAPSLSPFCGSAASAPHLLVATGRRLTGAREASFPYEQLQEQGRGSGAAAPLDNHRACTGQDDVASAHLGGPGSSTQLQSFNHLYLILSGTGRCLMHTNRSSKT
eukprot:1158800-Pelagomonas_calceolata.AAC.2